MTNISTERLEELAAKIAASPHPETMRGAHLTEANRAQLAFAQIDQFKKMAAEELAYRSLDKGEVVADLILPNGLKLIEPQVPATVLKAFEEKYHRNFDLSVCDNEWGNTHRYKHSHIQCCWEGWRDSYIALVSQPAPKGVEITEHGQPNAMDSAPFDRTILVWWPIVAVDDETGDLTDTEVDGRWLVTEWNGDSWLEPDVLNALNSNYFDDDCEYARSPKCWLPLPAAIEAMKEASNG